MANVNIASLEDFEAATEVEIRFQVPKYVFGHAMVRLAALAGLGGYHDGEELPDWMMASALAAVLRKEAVGETPKIV